MTRLEKCKIAIEKGITYDPISGKIYGVIGKEIINKNRAGYIRIGLNINGKCIYLSAHIFAWYITYNEIVEQIDHINGLRDDNRISNLRSVTNQQNSFNTKAKGYTWVKSRNKWQSQIMINNKNKFIGYFYTEEEAREAYLEAKEKYHIIKNPTNL